MPEGGCGPNRIIGRGIKKKKEKICGVNAQVVYGVDVVFTLGQDIVLFGLHETEASSESIIKPLQQEPY